MNAESPGPVGGLAASRPLPSCLPVTLALQGGGALGAFTWGVLERLLDEEGLVPAVVSGSSAGAMNGAMLVQGLATGGRPEAKRLLEAFWRRVAVAAGSPDLDGTPWLDLVLRPSLLHAMTDAWRKAASAFPQRQAQGLLRQVLDGLLDPRAFGRPGTAHLVVAATKLRTGEPHLFRDREVTADVLLASACLPTLMPPVEIAGELYWDGGFSSNPPLRPLIEATAPADVIVVRTSPLERPEPPRGAEAISARRNELAFDSPLRQELRSIAVARRLLAELPAAPPAGTALAKLCAARLHAIGDDTVFRALPPESAGTPRWDLFQLLRSQGQVAADAWLVANAGALGQHGTLDLAPFATPLVAADLSAAGPAPPDPLPWWRRALGQA